MTLVTICFFIATFTLDIPPGTSMADLIRIICMDPYWGSPDYQNLCCKNWLFIFLRTPLTTPAAPLSYAVSLANTAFHGFDPKAVQLVVDGKRLPNDFVVGEEEITINLLRLQNSGDSNPIAEFVTSDVFSNDWWKHVITIMHENFKTARILSTTIRYMVVNGRFEIVNPQDYIGEYAIKVVKTLRELPTIVVDIINGDVNENRYRRFKQATEFDVMLGRVHP
jgi:hypothetical protein